MGRVSDGAAEVPAVEVFLRAGHLDLEIRQPPQRVGNGGLVLGVDAAVTIQHHVAREQVLVRIDEGAQVGRADFFLTLEQELQVHAQRIVFLHRFDRTQAGVELAFHVRRPPRHHIIAAHRGLEGRAVPLLERVRRLHVVVAVDQ